MYGIISFFDMALKFRSSLDGKPYIHHLTSSCNRQVREHCLGITYAFSSVHTYEQCVPFLGMPTQCSRSLYHE